MRNQNAEHAANGNWREIKRETCPTCDSSANGRSFGTFTCKQDHTWAAGTGNLEETR